MFWPIVGIVTCVKLLLIPAYRSTDFEVHRNWLAVTYSLPLTQWYQDETSQWTLDYPPLFAWFEYFLAQLAVFFDPEMLKVSNLDYASPKTILFQRLSVIIADFVFAYGTKECCSYLSTSGIRKSSKWAFRWRSPVTILQVLLLANVGLLMVDHIHFQYNGFLFGILLLSIARALQDRCLHAAVLFTVLLNLKHIFIYIAPAYFIYLLRNYCFLSVQPGFRVSINTFSRQRFVKLCSLVLLVFFISFGPFIMTNQMSHVLTRLFPFKRGLCHAYWAPNIWALYNTVDKTLEVTLSRLGVAVAGNSSMTKGLVQDLHHSVLPNVSPRLTFLLTALSVVPALIKLWRCPGNPLHFLRCLVLCGLSAFLFGWHVHEKAILIPLIPLTVMAVIWQKEAQVYVVLSITGLYSLHPLLFNLFELPIKVLFLLLHCLYTFSNLSYLFDEQRQTMFKLPLLNVVESVYVLGFIPLFLSDVLILPLLGTDKKYPFLRLLLTSGYCSLGVTYCWLKYYWHFITMSEINHKRKAH